MYHFLITLFLLSGLISIADQKLIIQDKVGPNTCAPCSFVHSLSFAKNEKALAGLDGETNSQKAASFRDKYCKKPSPLYHSEKPIYQEKTGIADKDFLMVINQLFKESKDDEVKGDFLVKQESESPEQFIFRVHKTIQDSISKGFHPLISARALTAEYSEKSKKFLWNSKGGHWIAIHELSPLLKDSHGFSFKYSDSISAKLLEGYININLHRKAVVPMTFTVDEKGKEQWQWIPNDSTLELHSPGMPLGTRRAKWNERTFIALRFLIYR